MDEQRKKIIVKEIETWRKNHLLPEHYCVFLLNLYTAGERAADEASAGLGNKPEKRYGSQASVSWKMIIAWFIGAVTIAGLILLAFHFNDFSNAMQITIFSFISLFFYLLSFLCKRFAPAATHVTLALCFLLLIFGGLSIIDKFQFNRSAVLLYLAVICLFWCVNGAIFRFLYLVYCGFIGLGILYGYGTIERVSLDYGWWMAELYWVPFAILMTGIGFLLHQRNQRLAGALSICGILFLFGPEIQSLYIPQARQEVIQLLLFLKVFICSALFFFTRRYWFSWFRL